MAGLIRRGKKFYVTYQEGGREVRRSLETDSLQIAKERMRQLESRLARGEEDLFPTTTPLPEALDAYVEHMRATKTHKSAQADTYILREVFGQICQGLQITGRKVGHERAGNPNAGRQEPGCGSQPIQGKGTQDNVSYDEAD